MHLNRISRNDNEGKNKKDGDKSIELFAKLAQSYGFAPVEIVEDNTEDNKVKGIDIWITISDRRVPVDVKCQRKYKDVICLEHQNIWGKVGSLFKDYTEYIAFEFDDGFYLYKTKDLRNLFVKLVDIKSKSISTKNKKFVGIKKIKDTNYM